MNKKKFGCFFASIILIATLFSFSACEDMPYRKQEMYDENGVWLCRYLLNSTTECMVGDWTSEYKKEHKYLDYVFFPSYINNVEVVRIGLDGWGYAGDYIGRGKYFLPYTIKTVPEPTKADIYMISGDNCLAISFLGQICYVPSEYYQLYRERFADNIRSVYKANIVYNINYPNEEYKYHCVDNYAYSTDETPSYITIIPPDPEREGYEFAGWYKETECINAWDFEVDTLPLVQYDENDEEIFQETMLYAKWNILG